MGNDFTKNGTWKIYERRKGRRVKTRRKTELRKFMEDEKEKGKRKRRFECQTFPVSRRGIFSA